jgi:hypothetical protein
MGFRAEHRRSSYSTRRCAWDFFGDLHFGVAWLADDRYDTGNHGKHKNAQYAGWREAGNVSSLHALDDPERRVVTIVHGDGLVATNDFYTFRRSWNGRCDGCQVPVVDADLCWYWVGQFFSPIVHTRCFDTWVTSLPPGLRDALDHTIESGRIDLQRGNVTFPLEGIAEARAWQESLELARCLLGIGTFKDYVNHWSDDVSEPAAQLDALYESISIWEIYKRLLPNKPHDSYRPQGNTSCACPHEEGRTSLSMSINDAKGVYFCFHLWEGGNKMALYCEIKGIVNRPDLFHKLKRLMVWEFRGADPYTRARR